jgi:hypothetical protein
LCQRHCDFGPYRDDKWVSPFDHTACDIAEYFRKYMLPDFPGADANVKLEAILAEAPPWLLWCTHADVYARILGITLPDLSSVNRFARDDLSACLRTGPFECRRLPRGVYDPWTERGIQERKKQLTAQSMAQMTPRERKRALRLAERAQSAPVAPAHERPSQHSTNSR